MRWTQFLLSTQKENPTEAEIDSHKLMLRTSMLHKNAPGIYSCLPFFVRSIRKLESIIREEMNKNAQEILTPILIPAELYQESGRWGVDGKELIRVQDRKQMEYALGPTHEEAVTDIVRRTVRSYRQLPLCLYQIQDKFLDEIRPRFGVIRSREFIMKDGYSFHRDRSDLDAFYPIMQDTYTKIFTRCGLDFRIALGDSGPIGGSETREFVVLVESGESAVLWCPDSECGYTATDEIALGRVVNNPDPSEFGDLEMVQTPHCSKIEDVSSFMGVPPAFCMKAMVYIAQGELVVAFIRGDRQLNECKLRNRLGMREVSLAVDDKALREAGLEPGFIGPIGLPERIRVLADSMIEHGVNMVIGANREGYHYRNANWDRDVARPQFTDLTLTEKGDGCPRCGKPLNLSRGFEVGRISKPGTRYSEVLKASFLDEDGKEKPFIMGCYGIGVARTIAAVLEQRHDDNGIIWPISIAPFQVLVTSIGGNKEPVRAAADKIYSDLIRCGCEVLYDDRDLGAGFKLKDADLIGIPIRIVVGERGLKVGHGVVEIKLRNSNQVSTVDVNQVISTVKGRVEELQDELK